MRKVIGFSGQLKSGKTTAAQLLEKKGFARVRFAGPLKQMIKALGCTDEQVDGSLKEVPCELLCGHTPRYAMQTIGTEWGRDLIGPDIWINAWRHKVETYFKDGIDVVCDDVRFPNEVTAIRELGGKVVHIHRDEVLATPVHASEQLGLQHDVLVFNNGTLDELKEKILAL